MAQLFESCPPIIKRVSFFISFTRNLLLYFHAIVFLGLTLRSFCCFASWLSGSYMRFTGMQEHGFPSRRFPENGLISYPLFYLALLVYFLPWLHCIYNCKFLLTHSLTHSLTHPLNHSLTHSPTHPPTHSLTHWPTDRPTDWLTDDFIPRMTRWTKYLMKNTLGEYRITFDDSNEDNISSNCINWIEIIAL